MPSLPGRWLSGVLYALYAKPSLAREEIARQNDLSLASISQATRYLLECGAIRRSGEVKPHTGRPRVLLELNPDAGLFVCVDLEAARIRYALTNLRGQVRRLHEQDMPPGENLSLEDLLEGIQRVQEGVTPLAVTLSYPGLMDADGRITAVNLGWSKMPLANLLREGLTLPVFLESACRLYAIAEREHGEWRDEAERDDFIYVEAGRGVGLGIFSGGNLVNGARGVAGEFGHVQFDPAATERCHCGKTGCLEAIASPAAMVERYRRQTRRGAPVSYADLAGRASAGERAAREIVDRGLSQLALGLAHLQMLFDPAVILIGGELAREGETAAAVLRQAMVGHLPGFAHPGRLRASVLGVDIGLKGLASLAYRRVTEQPELLARLCHCAAGARGGR